MPSALPADLDDDPATGGPLEPVSLAARLAARLCHDFISPVSAIVSGLDLIEDPEQQDMREEAMSLIASSARKLSALLSFSRIAFGGSNSSEVFDVRELERLTRDYFEHVRAQLDWVVTPPGLDKPSARSLLGLAQLGAGALPVGGKATLTVTEETGVGTRLLLEAVGPRARLRPEVIDGLDGRPLAEGLGGNWVQAYFLRSIVDQAGGRLEHACGEEHVRVRVDVPPQRP